MKKIISSGCLLFLGFSCLGMEPTDKAFIYAVHKGAQAKMTFCVLDDEGHFVEKAEIRTGFDDPSPGQSIYNWQTDTNGLCVVKGNTKGGMWFELSKEGYYGTEGGFYFRSEARPYVIDGKWQPWNPINTIVLKPIKNPVPMYAKKVETVIPVLDEPVGFDLERGDWVSPYGKGRAPDFVFSFSYSQKPIRNQGNYEIEMTLGFDSPEDGIQDTYVFVEKWAALSTLRLPYVAPQGGYESVYRWNMSRIDMQRERSPELRDDQNYIFRVRTKIDENGKIISANYGKIHGAIETGGYLQDLPRLKFLYYFNPEPNSQNLEFNPDKNLFGGRDRFAP